MKPAFALLREGERLLSPSPDARNDALELLAHVLHAQRSAAALLDREADEAEQAAYSALLTRRRGGEPLQYILGEAWFMGLAFRVDHRALIPRQDTELLCELALEKHPKRPLELCTGSGAVAVSLAALNKTEVTATDISPEALSLARENAARHRAPVRFFQGDLFAALPPGERFDLILCNPPYLTARDMQALQTEVKREPKLALYGGPDGLDFYRRIRAAFTRFLLPGGTLLLEMGRGQAEALAALFAPYKTQAHKDLNGILRVLEVKI